MAEFFDFDAPLPRWAFARGSERLIMDRGATAVILLTFNGAASQVIRFDNPTDAAFFQSDLETELVRSTVRIRCFHTCARHPASEAEGVVVPSVRPHLEHGHASKFRAKNDKSRFQ